MFITCIEEGILARETASRLSYLKLGQHIEASHIENCFSFIQRQICLTQT